jgi:hypothetical protein
MSRARKSENAGGTHGIPHRLMAVWTARHDNGWVTSVVENPNGSFAAWAAPDGEGGGVYSIVDEAEDGKTAAAATLVRETGHTGCSRRCTGWSLRTYAVFDRRGPQRRPSSKDRRKQAPLRRSA